MFCGSRDLTKINEPVPEAFKPFLDFMNEGTTTYNQMVVNYYKDGSEFIPMHSDCKVGMVDDASITVIHLDNGEPDEPRRIFMLRAREGATKLEIKCTQGAVVTMIGATQEEFRHGVAEDETKYKRISLTFRSFK